MKTAKTPSGAPVVVEPYVHPKVWGPCSYHAEMRLLAVTARGVLVWIYAGSMWGGALSGAESVPGSLSFLQFQSGTQTAGSEAVHVHEGGRLSRALLDTYRERIDQLLGTERAALLSVNQCVLFDGVSLPPGAYLPTARTLAKPKSVVPTDIDPAEVLAVCEHLKEYAAGARPPGKVPAQFTLGGVPVSLQVGRGFGSPIERLWFRIETQTAADQYEADVTALREKLKAYLAAFRAEVPVYHGKPLVELEVRFSPSDATAVSWTEGHVTVVRNAVSTVLSCALPKVLPSNNPLVLALAVKSSH